MSDESLKLCPGTDYLLVIIISLLLGISVTCFTLMQVTGTDPRFFDQEEYEW
ncbi:MAG: hypothetical protein R3B69_00060 [Candidatus Paceibacterota bacterium]